MTARFASIVHYDSHAGIELPGGLPAPILPREPCWFHCWCRSGVPARGVPSCRTARVATARLHATSACHARPHALHAPRGCISPAASDVCANIGASTRGSSAVQSRFSPRAATMARRSSSPCPNPGRNSPDAAAGPPPSRSLRSESTVIRADRNGGSIIAPVVPSERSRELAEIRRPRMCHS